MNKKIFLEKAYMQGFNCERDYRSCSQCTVAAIQDALNTRNDYVYKAASGLAGGAGEYVDGICGGYSGGILMMSLLFGRTRKEESTKEGRKKKYDSLRMAAALHDKFIKKYGTVVCSEIQKKIFGRSFNLRDDKQKELFKSSGAHEDDDKCCAVVGNGAQWSAELIIDEIYRLSLSLKDFYSLKYIAI